MHYPVTDIQANAYFKGGGGLGGSTSPSPRNFQIFLKSEGKEVEKIKRKGMGVGGGGVIYC